MRIVGGRHKGRGLKSPTDRRIRPTSDRARETLFNLLAHGPYAGPEGPMPRGRIVLDVFAGTGALGLEALSRGASQVVFLESDAEALQLLHQNAAGLSSDGDVIILNRDATRPGKPPTMFHLVLMDPPYHSGLAAMALDALLSFAWLSEEAVVSVELAKDESFPTPIGFDLVDDRRQGAARFVILRRSN